MGRLADTVLEGGGEVIGVMPRGLFRGEVVHSSLTQLIEVGSMHERKAMMGNLADGFIALPGGFGTFEELFEVLCWSQIGLHGKAIGLLNVEDFYTPLYEFIVHASKGGFIHENHVGLCLMHDNPAELIERMTSFVHPGDLNKWAELEKE